MKYVLENSHKNLLILLFILFLLCSVHSIIAFQLLSKIRIAESYYIKVFAFIVVIRVRDISLKIQFRNGSYMFYEQKTKMWFYRKLEKSILFYL